MLASRRQSCALPRDARQFKASPHARPRARELRATHTRRGQVSQKAIMNRYPSRPSRPRPRRPLTKRHPQGPYRLPLARRVRCSYNPNSPAASGSPSASSSPMLDLTPLTSRMWLLRLPRYRGSGREIARTRVEPFRGFPGDHTPKPLPGERASTWQSPRPWKP